MIANFFADRGCHVVSVTDPYGRILGFLDRSCHLSIKWLLSCTHEAEWIPFQTHYFFSGSTGNRTRASGSVAKNSDYYTTEAVIDTFLIFAISIEIPRCSITRTSYQYAKPNGWGYNWLNVYLGEINTGILRLAESQI
jgi:hypothetical protein